MKKIFIILLILFLQIPVNAVTFNVLTLPADLFNMHENYFDFTEPSEIFATDIITNFNSTNGKITAPDLYTIRAKFAQNQELGKSVAAALKNFENSKAIDFKTYKLAGKTFNAKSVLIIRSYVTTDYNSVKRGMWDVLNMMSHFNAPYAFYLNTNIILLDTVNDIPMWQNTYVRKLGNVEGYFTAKNYSQARTIFEKTKKYSHDVVAADAAQNILLRFFPRVITPLETAPVKIEENGGTLRYNSNIPVINQNTVKINSEDENYGEMLLDF